MKRKLLALLLIAALTLTPVLAVDAAPAKATPQTILVNGKPVELQAYALQASNGYYSNYVKLRDVADLLDGTGAQFNVDWADGKTTVRTGAPYSTRNGQEHQTPYTGDQPYTVLTDPILVDGKEVTLDSFVIYDAKGRGSTYYKLRDLGEALGFSVVWDNAKGQVLVSTDPAVMTINGQTVTRSEYIAWLDQVVYQADLNLYNNSYGLLRLDWEEDYGVSDLKSFFRLQAELAAFRYTVMAQQAKANGCAVADLPRLLCEEPTREELAAYAQEMGYLAAKHILVDDLQTAQAILDGLDQVPTMAQFNALMEVFNTDPGMESYPEGYLFQTGDMVQPFEDGVKSLAIGAYSKAPVQSDFGYHIIWRLDPANLSECKDNYIDAAFEALVDQWEAEADVSVDTALLERVDPQVCYEQYLQLLAGQQ